MDDIFIKIITGEIPSYKIYEDELVVAILDINPNTLAHTLIIPKNKYTDIFEIPDNILIHIKNVALKLITKIENNLSSIGCQITINYGVNQEIKHFHMHIKPSYKEELIDRKDFKNILNKLK